MIQQGNTAQGLKQLLESDNAGKLDEKVRQLFKQYAGADRLLDPNEMQSLATSLSAQLGVSRDAFGEITMMFFRFDFSGDGQLNEKEGVKLIKYCLRLYRDSIAKPIAQDGYMTKDTAQTSGQRLQSWEKDRAGRTRRHLHRHRQEKRPGCRCEVL